MKNTHLKYMLFLFLISKVSCYTPCMKWAFNLSIVSGCFHIDAIKNYKKNYDRLQIVFDLKEIYLLLVYVNFVASDIFFFK